MGRSAKKATFLSSLGAGLEYYDFIIYGMMASTLSSLFFDAEDSSSALIKAFAFFAIGYIVRPLGGILFGVLGDTHGRKKAFLLVMLLMAIATFSIGLLPTYSQVGILAAYLLLILRLMQGFSFGAELPGAITVVAEYTEKTKRSIYSGFVISGTSIGSMLASFMLYLLSKNVEQETILQWGWRLPFFFGGLLAIVNYFIREYLQETPEFSHLQTYRIQSSLMEPLRSLFNQYRREVFMGTLMTAAVASLVIFALYLPTYLSTYFHYQMKEVYLAMTWSMVWSAVSLPLCGWISDRVGRMKTFISTCVLFSLCAFPLFQIIAIGGKGALIVFMILYQTVLSFLMVSYFALLPAAFPTSVRYTGVAFCYNIAYCAMSCCPIFITGLVKWTKVPSCAVFVLIVLSLLGTFGAFLLAHKKPILELES